MRLRSSYFLRRPAVVSFGVLAASVLLALPAAVSLRAQQSTVVPAGAVTFNRDVAPILFANCVSCHRPGEAAPFSLLTYDDARRRARLIATAVSSHVMPPWQPDSGEDEFEGDRRLARTDIATLVRWADEGALEGEPDLKPAPPVFTPGWRLGSPDLVLTMAEPSAVPADGPDVFRNFVLPIPLSDRRYVSALEFRPGNPRVLHHARMLLDDTADIRRRDEEDPEPGFGGMDVPGARFPDGHFLGWAPGQTPAHEAYPWPLDPGNDLVLQLHLKPTGRPELVQVSIGLYFTDSAPSRSPIMLRLGSKAIDIPAGASAYEVTDSFTLYRSALESGPNLAAAHNNLGRLLLARGAVGEAMAEFRLALRARPDNADAQFNLGRALVANGQPREAAQQWRRAVAARPDSQAFLLELAWLLATNDEVHDPGEAVRLGESANRLARGTNPAVLDVLAAAYASDGRVELAARTAQLALQRALAAKNDTLAAEIRQRLTQYQEAAQGDADSPDVP